jgi:hypothetical protein
LVVLGLTNKPVLIAKFVWLAPPERLTPAGRELAFPDFCCPLFVVGGANMTKVFVPLGLRRSGMAVDPITLPLDNLEGGSVTV